MCYNGSGRLGKLTLEEIKEKKALLRNKRQILQEEYEYYNDFNFTENLGKAISFLINKFENKDCVCTKIICEVPEHQEYVSRFFLGENHTVSKRYSKKNYTFVVVYEKDNIHNFDNLTFETFKDMEELLFSSSIFLSAYPGVIDLEMLEHAFPYLQHFFYILNAWRIKTRRVTLDEDIIQHALTTVISEDLVSQDYVQKI